MKKTETKTTPGDEQLILIEGVNSSRTDQSVENVLMKICKFIWLSWHFNQNPLKALRKHFPEFEWIYGVPISYDEKSPLMAYNANYLFNFGGETIIARKQGAKMRYAYFLFPSDGRQIEFLQSKGYTVFNTEDI